MNQKNSNGNDGRPAYQPMVQIAGVWERESAGGSKYFCGRLGASKLLIMKNKNFGQPGHESEAEWNVLVQAPAPKPTDAPSTAPSTQPARSYPPRRPPAR